MTNLEEIALNASVELLKKSLGEIQPKEADVMVAEALGIIEGLIIVNEK